MTRIGVFGAVCVVAAAAWAQQVDMKLQLAYTAFVIGEPVLVQVDVQNDTSDVIRSEPGSLDKLFFEVSQPGSPYDDLQPINTQPVGGKFEIPAGEPLTTKVELDKWFPLLKEGKYMARAVLLHKGVRYESQKKSFDIVPGIALVDGVQMFVKPKDMKRSFRLVYWHRNEVDRLFLRAVDEPEGRVWDTVDLGNLMRSQPPKLDIAPDGQITIVQRATQDAFIRTLLWSLPESLEVVERNQLLDPEVSASQRAKSLYGEMAGEKKDEKKSWWHFW
jgi:hypothetical protein